MNPRVRMFLQITAFIAVIVALFLLFPVAFRFAEGAARSALRLWWLVLLVVLGIWLVWGVGRRPKE